MTSGRLSREEYEALVEQAPVMIWRADTDGARDYVNQGWLAFTGRAAEQEAGEGWAEGVHPDDLTRRLEAFRDALGRRGAFAVEYRLRRHDAVYRWLRDSAAPLFDAGGAFAGYVGCCADVTDLVEARGPGAPRPLGLLHVCATCKKVREGGGAWVPFEDHLAALAGASFSHGICPDCARDAFPDIYKKLFPED